jgi:PAS domain S-box-containing protein
MQFTIEKDRSQIKVLVIEDEDYSRECISDFLELVGFSSIQAANGREGIEMFGQHEPDVVITDIKMPEMDGFDILKFLQSYAAETPVIVISGTDSLDDVTQCLKLGAWDYIIKPVYDYGVVEMSILRVLEKKQLIEENRRYKEYLEEEVIKRSDELLRGSVRFKTLFNLASDVMFIYDQNGAIIDCNEMAVRHTGYNRKHLLEKNMKDLIVEEDLELFTKILAKLPMRNSIMYESRFKCGGGAVAIMEQHATMITTETSPLMLAVCRDITERRKMEQDREELKKKIVSSQKAELVGILTGGIAHDFNNVLTALTGYISLLQGCLGSDGQTAEYAQKIADIAAKGQALTGRLMSFIRKKRDELVPVDIHKALRETESLLRPNSKSVKISLELGASNCTILGDESQIQNAFLNLGINARDAMPEGGKLTFKTYNVEDGPGQSKGGGVICIDVSDTGTGIDEKIINKIFDPLFTTKAPGEGTGLGLPGVLYCVKNLHGSIDVKSAVGAGTTFKITLPLFTQDSQTKIDLSNKEVLVVTHDSEATDMIIDRLAGEGINVRHFNETASALGRLKVNADNVAVIIVDYELPMFDEKSFADGVAEAAPDTLIIKMLCNDQISLGSNKDYAAFVNTPIDSDRFFESITMYIRDLVLGTRAG